MKSTIEEFLAELDPGEWQRQLREIAPPGVLVQLDEQLQTWDGTGVAVMLRYSHEHGVHVTLDGCPAPPRRQSW